jgi:hypothetical protein
MFRPIPATTPLDAVPEDGRLGVPKERNVNPAISAGAATWTASSTEIGKASVERLDNR